MWQGNKRLEGVSSVIANNLFNSAFNLCLLMSREE